MKRGGQEVHLWLLLKEIKMTHNSRCAFATGRNCQCSCGGSLHGGGSSDSSTSFSDSYENVRRVASIVIPIATAIPAIAPIITPIYFAYRAIDFGKSLYNAYNASGNISSFDKLLTGSLTKVIEKGSEDKAAQIAKSITLSAKNVITQVSQKTGVDENIYGFMLEGSIKNVMISGIANLASYTIENLIKQ